MLKQAPKQKTHKIDNTMMWNCFKINECEKCIYYKIPKWVGLLCLYVDDMLVIGNNKDIINKIKKMIKGKFDIKDMGLVDVYSRN